MAEFLLQKYNVEIRNPDYENSAYTSLALATIHSSKHVFKYLLDKGHDDFIKHTVCLSNFSSSNTLLIFLLILKYL